MKAPIIPSAPAICGLSRITYGAKISIAMWIPPPARLVNHLFHIQRHELALVGLQTGLEFASQLAPFELLLALIIPAHHIERTSAGR